MYRKNCKKDNSDYLKGSEKSDFYKLVLLNIVLFLLISGIEIFLIIKNEGRYSFDEFYALGSAELAFKTEYKRAYYVNAAIRTASGLFGKNYYAMKAVPFLVGEISLIVNAVSLNSFTKNKISIVVWYILAGLNALVLINHAYIRFYVFQELAYSVGALFLLKWHNEKETRKRTIYGGAYFTVFLLYAIGTEDVSGIAMILIAIVSLIACRVLQSGFKVKIQYIKLLVILEVLMFIIMYFVKTNEKLQNLFPDRVIEILLFYKAWVFVFFRFVLFALGITLVCLVISLVDYSRGSKELEEIQPLFFMSILPISAYAILFYNNSLLRTFAAYVPVILLFTVLTLSASRIKAGTKNLLYALAVIQILGSYPDFDVQGYWNKLDLKNELHFRDYGEAINFAKEKEAEGYTVASMLAMLQHNLYFDLMESYIVTGVGDNNTYALTDEEVGKRLEYLLNTENKYILIADSFGLSEMERLGKKSEFISQYGETYIGDICVFQIN